MLYEVITAPLPTGGYLEQADGTAWMALFCQNMMEMSVELAAHDPFYEDLCGKFVEHFIWIAAGINRAGGDGNFHLVYVIDPANQDEMAAAKAHNARMLERAIAMGGTATGEHGIGLGSYNFV